METTSGLPKKSSGKSKYKKTKTSSKKVNKPKLIRVLLDTGSDGDLMFHKKGTPKCFPYSARLVPKSWCTSNGTFHTEGQGKLNLQFFEYSHSKTITLQPDIVEYDDDSEKPTFDVIIGVESMTEFGIILNFQDQVITIDDDTLPMRDITNLPLPRKKTSFQQPCQFVETLRRQLNAQVHILGANQKQIFQQSSRLVFI